MKTYNVVNMLACCVMLILTGCASTGAQIPIDTSSSKPGSAVTIKGEAQKNRPSACYREAVFLVRLQG